VRDFNRSRADVRGWIDAGKGDLHFASTGRHKGSPGRKPAKPAQPWVAAKGR